ncbi:nuclear transport factor 2 family protein [Burkholderia pseudomultivorans]|uniref:nuclear transport factor 2 family protein n=1 Tax=Burkholderia pseudomultivorans TaxID=1207504 RepID=UPI00287537AF|nr:nuclear transport factor 2 family protein [Burkholderia pseudomultivorans]MDS0858655.1 nuclear transport factor 2 family protein [Burkholderia pseudomultivorans]
MIASDLACIERLLSDFAWYADRGNGTELAQLFVADGVLHVGGREFTGRVAIAEDCETRARDPLRKTRHVWSNLRVERSDTASASLTAVQLTFEQRGDDAPAELRISDLHDDVCKDADGAWRFRRRVIQRQMTLAM